MADRKEHEQVWAFALFVRFGLVGYPLIPQKMAKNTLLSH